MVAVAAVAVEPQLHLRHRKGEAGSTAAAVTTGKFLHDLLPGMTKPTPANARATQTRLISRTTIRTMTSARCVVVKVVLVARERGAGRDLVMIAVVVLATGVGAGGAVGAFGMLGGRIV